MSRILTATMKKCPCEANCPNRSAECRLTCEAWKEYEAERNKVYQAAHPKRIMKQYEFDRWNRIMKEKSRHK